MMSSRSTTRRVWSLSAVGALTLAGSLLPAASFATDPPAETCTVESIFPGLGGGQVLVDGGVAVYAGRDYTTLPGAQESEGLLVVGEDATFGQGGWFNVGTVGVGSGIVPAAGTDFLVTGGALDITSGTVDVGHGLVANEASGGNVVTGATLTIAAGAGLQLNGGTATSGVGRSALDPHVSLSSALVTTSSALADAEPNGSVDRVYSRMTFTSGGAEGMQVFEVEASELSQARSLTFVGLPAAVPVVINVIGETATLRPNFQAFDDIRIDDTTSPVFGEAASRILWNFSDATSVLLGKQDQLIGSILVPSADSVVSVQTSTNGRLYVGGDLTFGGGGTYGIEHHSYPWVGGGVLSCEPEEETEEPVEPTPTSTPTSSPTITPTPAMPTPTPPTVEPTTGPTSTSPEPTPSRAAPSPTASTSSPSTDPLSPPAPVEEQRRAGAAGAGGVAGSTPPTKAGESLASTGAGTSTTLGAATLLLGAGVTIAAVRRRSSSAGR